MTCGPAYRTASAGTGIRAAKRRPDWVIPIAGILHLCCFNFQISRGISAKGIRYPNPIARRGIISGKDSFGTLCERSQG